MLSKFYICFCCFILRLFNHTAEYRQKGVPCLQDGLGNPVRMVGTPTWDFPNEERDSEACSQREFLQKKNQHSEESNPIAQIEN